MASGEILVMTGTER